MNLSDSAYCPGFNLLHPEHTIHSFVNILAFFSRNQLRAITTLLLCFVNANNNVIVL